VLKDAETLNHNQFGYEESYGCTSSQLRDLESGEADEWGMKDSLHEADSFIEVAIQKQKEQLSAEVTFSINTTAMITNCLSALKVISKCDITA
jgi:hypothetical protein